MEGHTTIASAVVVPEDMPSFGSTRSSKRSPSPLSSTDRKRTRTSISPLRGTEDASAAVSNGEVDPSRETLMQRRKSGLAEERKRGQRLFGNLLGTLSQSGRAGGGSVAAQKRRGEIEKRQREKLRVEGEKEVERRRVEEGRRRERRGREQVRFEREAMKTRHANLLAMAGFLKTKAEPVLYYQPWKAQPEDDETIKAQIREAEDLIRREEDEFDRRQRLTESKELAGTEPGHDVQTINGNGDNLGDKSQTEAGEKEKRSPDKIKGDDAMTSNPKAGPDNEQEAVDKARRDAARDDDDGGGVMMEHEEDTVMY
ncbi:MAG: hypothetical protein M1814_006529 [Vezdaea aestivalis]|nr:MAG: hypothetical protein M1814_006529 [Vezdaea aestivalis]